MSARVDFYLLSSGDASERLRFSCRLTQKAWTAGHRIFVHVGSDQAASEMDKLLWSFSQQSFIPHAIAGTAEAAHAPVVIGTDPTAHGEHDLLISLVDQFSKSVSHFKRVAEVVASDEGAKASARERFKRYRAMGVEPNTHNI